METNKNKMSMSNLHRPPVNIKKIVIIVSVIAAVCLSASGGLYYMLKGSTAQESDDGFGPPRRAWHDATMPTPNTQTGQEVMAYMDSADFKKLNPREQFDYMREGGRQVMEYQMDTYFSTPKEQRTAYLDSVIDRMQAMRQMRPPRRPRDANEPNDPNMQRLRNRARQQAGPGGPGGRRIPNPSRMRAMRERGTPVQRAQRTQFMQAMQTRMQQRGITMPGPGGGAGGRGGTGGRGQ